MKLLSTLVLLVWARQVHAKAVFAHFMVGNTDFYTLNEWESDIRLAREAHIDGFALNIARGEKTNNKSLANAFEAANNVGEFKLFFSFDYAGHGDWPKEEVIALIKQYGSNAGYFKHDSQPLVSTFEGPDRAADWPSIKEQTDCYFVPSWSSLGAQRAIDTGVVDGLFSWAAWPNGPNDLNSTVDDSYMHFLNKTTYMMPVSPWFYTNLPGFDKNWLWRGDDLWYDRWQDAIRLQPEYVQIISWNDYGESHYIGPLHNAAFKAFDEGISPYNYALNMPHDGWRDFLPYVIDTYKNKSVSVTREGVVSWYRIHPGAACTTGGTTGNTQTQGQVTFAPADIAQDKIFYSALLNSTAEVTVQIGVVNLVGSWENIPAGGVGIYHGSVPFSGSTGEVTVTVKKGEIIIGKISGKSITTTCKDNIQNFNAWVGSSISGVSILAPHSGYLVMAFLARLVLDVGHLIV